MHSSHVVASLAGALAAGACGTVVGLRPAAPPTLATTARAAAFTLPSHEGRTVALSDVLAQRDVVLVFYRGHW